MTFQRRQGQRLTSEERIAIVEHLKITGNASQTAAALSVSPSKAWLIAKSENIDLVKACLTSEERTAIAKHLKKTGNVAQTAAAFDVSQPTVYVIAKSENIDLRVSRGDIAKTLHGISGCSLSVLATQLDISYASLSHFSAWPYLYSAEWIRKNVTGKLAAFFPDKALEIKALELLTCQPHVSATSIKKQAKHSRQARLEEFQSAAGMLLAEMMGTCGETVASIQGRLNRHPTVQRNLPRLIESDTKLSPSIYREAIPAILEICQRAAPQKAAPYSPVLKNIGEQLRS